jgi:hypothetical protein
MREERGKEVVVEGWWWGEVNAGKYVGKNRNLKEHLVTSDV